MHIEEAIKLDFKDVLIKPKRSSLYSRKLVDLNRTFSFKYSNRSFTGVPIIAANMDTIGTMEMASELRKYNVATALHKHLCPDELTKSLNDAHNDSQPNLVFCSIGMMDKDLERLEKIQAERGDINVCIDVANGYSEAFEQFVAKVRAKFPLITIMAGNVVTSEMTEQLIVSGADIVKVGIGPGSVCTTRKQTGVGYPQLSAIIECADAAHGLGGLVCADGGCTVPGDVAKAFGAGADFVMLGGMLAGHDECNGKIIGGGAVLKYIGNMPREFDKNWTGFVVRDPEGIEITTIISDVYNTMYELYHLQKRVKHHDPAERAIPIDSSIVQRHPELFDVDASPARMEYYGMSSETAMNKHSGGVAEYRSSEGKTVEVPYKGKVEGTIKDILGGLRSACTYVGAVKLKELSKRTTFIRVTQTHNHIFGE